MIVNRLKKTIKGALEGFLAVLLVLLFYSVFLYFLNTLFPSGTSLKALIADQGSTDASGLSKDGNRGLIQNDDGSESHTASEVAAVISMTRNEVKSKGAGQIAWRSAQEGASLYDRDAVQTLSRSAAAIQFAENTTLDMGSNSLVIIKRLTHDPVYREKRSFMVLVEGDMRGKMDSSDQESVYLEIATPGANFRTESGGPGAENIDFKISVNPDKSTTISVYEGSAEVTAEGETVTVEANQSTVVSLNQAPIDPRNLLPAVKLKKPSGNNTFHYRDLPPKIRFAWKTQQDASRYHFMVARDAGFRDIVTDEVFSKTKFTHGNLKKGTYFWKVSALEETIEGFFSETRQLRVIRDRKPPMLKVKFPPQTIYRGRYTLRGKTDPGAKVFVGGQRVKTKKNGSFNYDLKLRPGINVIIVEAFDAVNNVTYRTQRINRKI
jgi:mannose-6-phosphate isomerase-like protein (cupin superfamily)